MQAEEERYRLAMTLAASGEYEKAANELIALKEVPEIAPICDYQLAVLSNIIGDPEAAYELFYQAFTALPYLCSIVLSADHENRGYFFLEKKEEIKRTDCPLCAQPAKPHWCYSMVEADGYNDFFNPIRMWMYCERCHHLFARHFPEKLFLYNNSPRMANPTVFPYYSRILGNIRDKGFATGMDLLEVGIGACECVLAAREIGYTTFGIDVIERHVTDAKQRYGLDAETADFNDYTTDKKWDIIIMGDVLEHVSDPEQALHKACALLNDDGAVWISTPSFDSAFSMIAGHNDPMRRQVYHLNYFSRDSLYMLLERCGLAPVDYQISSHYNGSMEVTAVKRGRFS